MIHTSDRSRPVPWKHISVHGREALKYMEERRNGTIKSVLTPWPSLNRETLNGFEWKTVVQLAGNSGSGKTAIKDQFTRSARILNPDQDFAILDFQFEMTGNASIMRDTSKLTGWDLKKLSSAFTPLSDIEFLRVQQTVEDLSDQPIYVIDVSKNVEAIEKSAIAFHEFIQKPIICTLDHSLLVDRGTEKDEFEVVRQLAAMLIRNKKRIPVIWIILNQFNNGYEASDRQIPNSINAFPLKRDVYGGNPIFFASDQVIASVLPSSFLEIGKYYGPERYGYRVTKELMVWHMLKNRHGELNAKLRMSANFQNMRVDDPSAL